jgi:hypothetical protein
VGSEYLTTGFTINKNVGTTGEGGMVLRMLLLLFVPLLLQKKHSVHRKTNIMTVEYVSGIMQERHLVTSRTTTWR